MRATRPLEQALRLTGSRPTAGPTPTYICLSCRARAAPPSSHRQLHTTVPRAADVPLYQRLKESLFGTKESVAAAKSREEKQAQRFTDLAERPRTSTDADDNEVARPLETKTDKHGRRYEIADIVDPAARSDYVQATTWQGLETVGSVEWVKKRADTGDVYAGFAPPDRSARLRGAQWEMLLRHVVVEAVVLRKAGRSAEQICWPREGSDSWSLTRGALLEYSSVGGLVATFSEAGAEKRLRNAIPKKLPEVQATQTPEDSGDQLREAIALAPPERPGNATPAWMAMPLQDPGLKLAIIKRILQITGRRLPDPVISKSPTLAHLYHALLAKPKPKRLAQTPQLKRLNINIPNATVHAGRQTPIHKDKEVGRWKVIENELINRGLPVTGSRYQGARIGVY
ncbi:hypothetical protein LTR08_008623 [Meristemomyces frigidus]|nr:hypothetical protein LTR08_008623 [Meristemomyces frigidus]